MSMSSASPPESSLDVAVIGNCTVAGLVNTEGRFVFCCYPRLDSDPLFCDLLAGGQLDYGFWDILLEDYSHSEQYYLRNTAILITRLHSVNGDILELVDFAPRFTLYGRSFHPSQLVRIVRVVAGQPRITVRIRPAMNYGKKPMAQFRGSNHIRFSDPDSPNSPPIRLTSSTPTSLIHEEIPFVVLEEFVMLLGPDESLTRSPMAVAHEFLEATTEYWHTFTQMLKIPFEWQTQVIRSAITLKLCSYEESGAIMAALTTSVPEAPNTPRTWDYRYCWLRDSYHTVKALNFLGETKTMEGYLRFIINIVAGAKHGDLQPLYGILYQTELTEELIDTLPGYRGMGPVRHGNAAYFQVQNDNYGSVILAVCQMFFDERISSPGQVGLFRQLEHIGTLAIERHDKPDAGLWELRGAMRVHTFSSVMCWAACDRLAKIAAKLELPDRAEFWGDWAKTIHTYVMDHAWDDEMNSFVSVLSGETREVDSCLLLLAELGFVSGTDPKYIATVERIGEVLMKGDFLYRYVVEDDFGVPENAFTICTFWYINALAMIGRVAEARELFEKILKCANHVGLFSEDLDTTTFEMWGNFPQTYSLVGLINSAIRLSVDWNDAGLC